MEKQRGTTAGFGAGRLDGVDVIRGLAILFVLLNHVNMRLVIAKVPYTQGLPAQLVSSLVWKGQFGVQMFFAVSGFLITSTAIRRWALDLRVRVTEFYRFRFARIAPLLLLLLAILSILHMAHVHDFVVPARAGGLGRALLAALTFHVNVLEARGGYLPGNWDVLWSLSVEEAFYLFFPLVCWFVGGGKRMVAILLAFIVLGPFARTVLAHGNETWQEYSYLGGMDAIALGCLTALLVARVRLSRSVLRWSGFAGAAALLLLWAFSIRAGASVLGRTGLYMSLVAAGTCLVILTDAQTRWKSPRVFRSLLALGRYSYEIYLTHMFVVFACFHLCLIEGRSAWAVLVFFVAAIVLSGTLGAAVSQVYTEPMNRLLRSRNWAMKPIAGEQPLVPLVEAAPDYLVVVRARK